MKKTFCYLLIAVLLSVTAIAFLKRTLIHREGRNIKAISLDSNTALPSPAQYKTIGDIVGKRNVSILKGEAIHEYFRAQIPAIPLISTQADRLKVDPEATYLITTDQKVFEQLQWLIEESSIYRSHGVTYDGVRYPHAYVLESKQSPKVIKELPYRSPGKNFFPESSYLYLDRDKEVELFFSGPKPRTPIKIILPNSRSLQPDAGHHDYLSILSSIYVLGKNALHSGPWKYVTDGKLHILPTGYSANLELIEGSLQPPPKKYYKYGLTLAGVSLVMLGIIIGKQPFFWVIYGGLYFLIQSTFARAQPALAALLGMAVIRLSWDRTNVVKVFFWVLSGLLMFSWSFQPHRLDPGVGADIFSAGLIGSILVIFLFHGMELHRKVRRADWLILLLGITVLASSWFTLQDGSSRWAYYAINLSFPLILIPVHELRYYDRWPIIAGMASWGLFFYTVTSLSTLLWFLLAIMLWGFRESTVL